MPSDGHRQQEEDVRPAVEGLADTTARPPRGRRPPATTNRSRGSRRRDGTASVGERADRRGRPHRRRSSRGSRRTPRAGTPTHPTTGPPHPVDRCSCTWISTKQSRNSRTLPDRGVPDQATPPAAPARRARKRPNDRRRAPRGDRPQGGDRERRADEERRLPGQRRQRDEDAGPPEPVPADGHHRAEEEQHDRGLLARTVGGVEVEARRPRTAPPPWRRRRRGRRAARDRRRRRARSQATDSRRNSHPHGEHVVDAEPPGRPAPRCPGTRWLSGPEPVDDAFVRRHPVGDLLAGVRVEGQVAAEVAVEAAQPEDVPREQGQRRAERVDPRAQPVATGGRMRGDRRSRPLGRVNRRVVSAHAIQSNA